MGQVIFANSTFAGSMVSLGLFAEDPGIAALAVIGCASATATARFVGADAAAVSAGLTGYNGALIGCALAAFLAAPFGLQALASVVGGAATSLLATKLGTRLSPMPQWTWAFNIIALSVLVIARPLKPVGETMGMKWTTAALDYGDWVSAALNGISQIFVVNNSTTGLLILAGVGFYSLSAAAFMLLGSVVGILYGIAIGADAEELADGLWGYNPALTALSISAFFVPLGLPFYILAAAGTLASAVLTSLLRDNMGNYLRAPCLTVPFCTAASACYLLGGRIPGLILARTPHSAHMNLWAYRAGR